jgi:hypothetical protein
MGKSAKKSKGLYRKTLGTLKKQDRIRCPSLCKDLLWFLTFKKYVHNQGGTAEHPTTGLLRREGKWEGRK